MHRVCRPDDSVSADVSAASRLKSADSSRCRSEDNESECLALAQEGERLIRDNDVHLGIQYLEKAIEVGTKKVQLLTAIYSQLGNAYFSIRNYTKALHFHHNDLVITVLMKDPAGEAKACGNLGNTYKALANYKDAVYYCELHLKIAQSINDPTCVARALYNLATVYHSKGRQNNPPQPSNHDLSSASVSQAYKDDLKRAVDLYKQNLEVVEQLDDPYSRGRTYGNLGNVYYLLGDFETAVFYHQKRLDIARQFGDRAAMRRAYSNLGNAHVYMSKLEEAVQFYKLALSVAQEQGDRIGEAQVCFGLGNSATIQGDFDSAIDYHLRHLSLARELKDSAGEARACASLAVNFENKNDRPKALYFLALNKKLALEMRDHAMEVSANDQIKQLLQDEAGTSLIVDGQVKIDDSADPRRPVDHSGGHLVGSRSMPNLLSASLQSLIMKTCMASGVSATPLDASLHSSTSVDCGLSRTSATELFNASKMSKQSTSTSSTKGKKSSAFSTNSNAAPNEDFFDMIQRMQSKRIDDQRCDPVILNDVTNKAGVRQSDNISIATGSSSQFSADALTTKKKSSSKSSNRRHSLIGRLRLSLTGTPQATETPAPSSSFAPPVTSTPLTRPGSSKPRMSFPAQQRRSISFICEEGTLDENDISSIAPATPRQLDEGVFRVPSLPPPHRKKRREVQSSSDASFASTVTHKDRRMSLDPSALRERMHGPEAILDLIALIQGRRMEEQRAHLVLPGLNNPEQLLEKLNDGEAQTNDEGTFDHEHLYEMVLRCQADRLEDQRSELGGRRTMTIPEEDISMLVMKMQAGRLEEQRAHLTRPESVDTSAAQQPAEEGRAAEAQNPKN
ncbi:hypothetical protein QR680_016596 [Steinernema hermaphroditum]|uniref:G-protein-signaling modulator 2 n=1 Tax=Steinernema hermaphroditum TaxID=289476 RepID=A0AA39LM76_9BILA|nr:hypothetical protein QR680_016596 [Steinernema hermaphroditum]